MVIKSHFLLQIVIREYTKIRPHEPVTLKQSAKIGPMNFYESTVYFIDIKIEYIAYITKYYTVVPNFHFLIHKEKTTS